MPLAKFREILRQIKGTHLSLGTGAGGGYRWTTVHMVNVVISLYYKHPLMFSLLSNKLRSWGLG